MRQNGLDTGAGSGVLFAFTLKYPQIAALSEITFSLEGSGSGAIIFEENAANPASWTEIMRIPIPSAGFIHDSAFAVPIDTLITDEDGAVVKQHGVRCSFAKSVATDTISATCVFAVSSKNK